MGDTAAVQSAAVVTATPSAPAPSSEDRATTMLMQREQARQARRASAMAKITSAQRETLAADAGIEAPEPTTAPQATAVVQEAPKPAAPVEAAKPPEPAPDDESTKRGLAAIEHARKRFMDEQAQHKAELEVQRAEVARLRQEAQGKLTSADELKKLDLAALLDKLGLDDSKLTQLSREAYYRTSEGQKNPAAKQAVEEVRMRTGQSALEQQIAELRRELDETKRTASEAQKLVFQREYANEWVEGALKAVPADKPTLFGQLHAKNPKAAKAALLAIGGELEKASGADQAPNAAEVLAEYESRQRAFLESQGIDVERLLAPVVAAKPAAPAPAAKPVARTLDPSAPQITRADAVPTSREERRANALAKLRVRQRTTADQVP